ncbi:MAG: serine hydrolase domain-containing protein [Acidobacteriota bacterium]|nr:serine hydrolase domain-containing protein [Acidobacteriota bacterium]
MKILPHYFSTNGPGAALAVVPDGLVAQVECYGLADREAGVEITPETVFDLASASKMFTATGVVLLAEEGRLDLATPVVEVLPQLEHSGVGRPITVRDLLWHTSGLQDYLQDGMYTPPEEASAEFVDQQLPAWMREARPGVSHSYSNTNYFLLSKVLEAAAGCSYSEFLKAHLFAPLGLRDTFVAGGRSESKGIAKGYRNFGYGLPLFELSEELALDTVGDGGVFSSLRDLMAWQSALWKGELVSEASLKLMQTPGHLDSGEAFDYGLGLQVERSDDGRVWCGHGGSWTSSTVLVGRYVKEETNLTLLSNEFMAPVERISQRALALGEDPEITPQSTTPQS